MLLRQDDLNVDTQETAVTATSRLCLLVSIMLLPLPAARADDLSDATQIICAATRASECYADGSCVEGEPEDWNVPRFMRLDLETKILSTTKASGEERSTPLTSLKQEADRIFIQGAQAGRAVSMVINQSTGLASAGIVLDGHVLNVFAHCTPLESSS